MIIKIVAPMKHEEFIKVLEAVEEPKFKFVRKMGINLEFECSLSDKKEACEAAKKALKRNPELMLVAYSVLEF